MPFCQSCGTQITTKAAFCPECGAPSASSQKTNFTDTPNTDKSLSPQVKVSENNEQALFWAKQVVMLFIWQGLSVLKGAASAEPYLRNNLDFFIETIVITILVMAVTYIFLVVKGVKENNANYVLITAIFFTVLFALGLPLNDYSYSNNNFWDWLGIFVPLIQMAVTYKLYFTLLKSV
jgi:hypothetical protein